MILSSEKIPIKIWTDEIEEEALEQAKNLANLPFAFHHIAIMPDVHTGFGMPIGGVLATKDVIIPNSVGSDIGCGMCAVKTSLTEIDTNTLKKIIGKIRKVIPVGFEHHSKKQDDSLMPQGIGKLDNPPVLDTGDCKFKSCSPDIIKQEYESALTQLGTLGGGNHFIEIQKGSDGHIWIMIHSGSRNLGLKVAEHYNKLAIELNKKWYSYQGKELAFLPIDSEEGQDYLREMRYCVEFALANRELMMDRIKKIFIEKTNCEFDEMINIAHNYASLENHFGENVWVHRKGATQAKKGRIGIIPGSQGTKSYIVKGLGNPDSFMSCSHGSGRLMSRTKARESLSLEGEKKILDDLGIIHSIRGKSDLDEAPSAYKDIESVMNNQKDLVEIKVELTPLAVIKG